MKFISLFAGIGGFDLGMEQAGHECVAQVEWDKNAAGVLKRRWPEVPLFCDVTKVNADDLPDADFITFGFPCQDLSVAGKREGLQGKRSGLFYESTRLIRGLLARGSGLRFALAENVAGLLSADDGIALAKCIRELLDCGAGEVGYRILDSQYFGVAQRRRRVFIVSDFGGQSCDQILALTESLPRHPPPRRKTGQGSPSHAGASPPASGRTEGDVHPQVSGSLSHRDYKGPGGVFNGEPQGVVAVPETSDTVTSKWAKGAEVPQQGAQSGGNCVIQGADVYNATLTGDTAPTVTSATGISNASGPKVIHPQGQQALAIDFYNNAVNPETSQTISSAASDKNHIGGVMYPQGQQQMAFQDTAQTITAGIYFDYNDEKKAASHLIGVKGQQVTSWCGDTTPKAAENVSVTLRSQQGGEGAGVAANMIVRRLTPTECERLQGFPDQWTEYKQMVELEGNEWVKVELMQEQADGPRYRQLGNAVTVNVAKWIGLRLMEQA